MKMSEEQFDALGKWIERLGRPDAYPWDAEAERAEARRLLVDDESPKADPDLTTFGELKTGQWFQVVATGCRLVKPPQHVLAMGGMDAIDLRGCPHIMPNGTPVRRLPKPEFPK